MYAEYAHKQATANAICLFQKSKTVIGARLLSIENISFSIILYRLQLVYQLKRKHGEVVIFSSLFDS